MTAKRVVLLKIAIIAIVVWYVLSYNSSASNLDIYASVLIPTFFFFIFSIWLSRLRRKYGVNLDESISLSGEFWPMMQHPFQSFALASVALMAGGIAAMLKVVFLNKGNINYGSTCLFFGFSVGLAAFFNYSRANRR
jgi:hypothetical protein